MQRTNLGEFEELVLLIVGTLGDGAYGVAVQEAMKAQAGRGAKISAVHSALHRLEKKGYLTSQLGQATAERGGRRKRLFTLTSTGREALEARYALRNRLWERGRDLGLAGGTA